MEKYIEAELEILRFDALDVIATSCSFFCEDCGDDGCSIYCNAHSD